MPQSAARPCFVLATNETGYWTPVSAGATAYQCLSECYEEEPVAWGSPKFIIVGGFIPLVAMIGLPANILVSVIYSRPNMRQVAINKFLFFLALSDIGVILMAVSLFAVNIYKPHVPVLTSIYVNLVHLWYPLANTFQLNSIMLTVSAAMHCYYGLREQVYGTANRLPKVRFMIAISFVLALAFNAIKGFEIAFFKCYSAVYDMAVWDVTAAEFRGDQTYQFLYYTVATSLIQTLLPLPALVLLARLIVRTSQHPEAGEEAQGDARNLIAVVILFITCNTPSLAIIFMEKVYSPAQHPFMIIVMDISNALVVWDCPQVAVNSSLNFFLYLIFSETFRNTLRAMVRRGCGARRKRRYLRKGSEVSGKRLHEAGSGHYQYFRVTTNQNGRGNSVARLTRRWSPLQPLHQPHTGALTVFTNNTAINVDTSARQRRDQAPATRHNGIRSGEPRPHPNGRVQQHLQQRGARVDVSVATVNGELRLHAERPDRAATHAPRHKCAPAVPATRPPGRPCTYTLVALPSTALCGHGQRQSDHLPAQRDRVRHESASPQRCSGARPPSVKADERRASTLPSCCSRRVPRCRCDTQPRAEYRARTAPRPIQHSTATTHIGVQRPTKQNQPKRRTVTFHL